MSEGSRVAGESGLRGLGCRRGMGCPGNGLSGEWTRWGMGPPGSWVSGDWGLCDCQSLRHARVSLVHLLIFTTSGSCGSSELPCRKELHLITSATRALARVSPKRLPKIATLLGGATPQEGAKPFHSFPKNCLFARLRARLSEGAILFNLHPARALARVPGSPPTCSTHLRKFDQSWLFQFL